MSKPDVIGECGHPVYPGSKICRPCWLAKQRKEPARCEDCGHYLNKGKHGGVALSKRCWPCHQRHVRNMHPCQQCGKPRPKLKGSESTGQLCRECWLNRPRKRRPCKIPGCARPHRARGLCMEHYKTWYETEHGRRRIYGRDATACRETRAAPCQLCGYNKLPSEAHRIKPELGYVVGNLIPLCARCHREVTRGITALPDIRL